MNRTSGTATTINNKSMAGQNPSMKTITANSSISINKTCVRRNETQGIRIIQGTKAPVGAIVLQTARIIWDSQKPRGMEAMTIQIRVAGMTTCGSIGRLAGLHVSLGSVSSLQLNGSNGKFKCQGMGPFCYSPYLRAWFRHHRFHLVIVFCG